MRKYNFLLFFLVQNVLTKDSAKNAKQSLEYKPIKPSYLSSGTNVAQIVPPGQPWPANAAGYTNFSQINQNSLTSTMAPQLEDKLNQNSSMTSLHLADDQMIYLDFSNIDTNLTSEFEEILADQLKIANVPTFKPEMKIIPLDITPPENSNSNYVEQVENSIKIIVDKYAPLATTFIRIEVTKRINGIITNLRIFLNISPPKLENRPILPQSSRPEIDLTQNVNNLTQGLQEIVVNEFIKNSFDVDKTKYQRFNFSFNILPPEGSNRDFVKQNVLKTLQKIVRQISTRATISSVSVNTLEINGRILRQTVTVYIKIKPKIMMRFGIENSGIIEISEIDFSNNTNVILQEIIDVNNMPNSGNKTLIIPIKITPAQYSNGKTIEKIVELLENILKKTSGGISEITRKVLENGDVVSTIYVNLFPENIIYTSGTLETSTTTTKSTSGTTVAATTTSTTKLYSSETTPTIGTTTTKIDKSPKPQK